MKLPDISNWKTDNLKHIKNIFEGCESMIDFPDISRWSISKDKEDFLLKESSQNINSSWTLTFSKNTEKENENSLKVKPSSMTINEQENNTNNSESPKEGHQIEYYDIYLYFNNDNNLNYDYYDNFYNS